MCMYLVTYFTHYKNFVIIIRYSFLHAYALCLSLPPALPPPPHPISFLSVRIRVDGLVLGFFVSALTALANLTAKG